MPAALSLEMGRQVAVSRECPVPGDVDALSLWLWLPPEDSDVAKDAGSVEDELDEETKRELRALGYLR
jgi:hypothetical protein